MALPPAFGFRIAKIVPIATVDRRTVPVDLSQVYAPFARMRLRAEDTRLARQIVVVAGLRNQLGEVRFPLVMDLLVIRIRDAEHRRWIGHESRGVAFLAFRSRPISKIAVPRTVDEHLRLDRLSARFRLDQYGVNARPIHRDANRETVKPDIDTGRKQ